jgi:hypothetical protein
MAGFCERGNEPSDSIKCGELLNQLRNVSFSGRQCSLELVMFVVNFLLKCQMNALECDFDLGGFVEGGQTLRCL